MPDETPEHLEPPKEPKASLPLQRFEQPLLPQIPPSTWNKLSGDQFFQLANQFMQSNSEVERHRLQLEESGSERADRANTKKLIVGAVLFCVGIGAGAYLAVNNHAEVGTAIIAALTTLLAVVIGRRPYG